ncbi:MAG: polysaccharide deacetylase family protein [Chloroflexota bacterium]|nr:polysaccharide deacetylase family protein [Chloroflexota bacterium]
MSAKRKLASALFKGLYFAGKKFHDGGISILSYHSLDDYGTPLSVSPRLFAAHMKVLDAERYTTLTMSQVAEHLADGLAFPPRSVAVTFDDGFANLASVGASIMARYGVSATVYVIAGMAGKVTAWTDTGGISLPHLPLLTWKQIEALQAGGGPAHIEIGAHSMTHGFLTDYPRQQLEYELVVGKAEIERRLGVPASAFAYPQGDYNARVVAATRGAGYTTAVTVDQGRATPRSEAFMLPRLLVSNNTTPERLRAVLTPASGSAYVAINILFKRVLGRPQWPRRAPGEVDSTRTMDQAPELAEESGVSVRSTISGI